MKNGRNSTVSFVWTLLLQQYTLMSPKLNCTGVAIELIKTGRTVNVGANGGKQMILVNSKTITVYVHLLFPIVVDGALFEC